MPEQKSKVRPKKKKPKSKSENSAKKTSFSPELSPPLPLPSPSPPPSTSPLSSPSWLPSFDHNSLSRPLTHEEKEREMEKLLADEIESALKEFVFIELSFSKIIHEDECWKCLDLLPLPICTDPAKSSSSHCDSISLHHQDKPYLIKGARLYCRKPFPDVSKFHNFSVKIRGVTITSKVVHE